MDDNFNTHSDPSIAPTCTTGSCGGSGLCPGIAFFIALIAGSGITMLTGLPWLGWAVGIPLALILITGAWRWLPGKRVATAPPRL